MSETQSEQVEHHPADDEWDEVAALQAELDRIRTDRNILSKSNADLLAELDQAREREKNFQHNAHKALDEWSRRAGEAERREKALRDDLEWIGLVAESWHGDDDAKGRALKVISQRATEALAAQPESPQEDEQHRSLKGLGLE